MEIIVLDSNILIEILKGKEETISRVQTLSKPLSISSITVMELIIGARNKQEVSILNEFIELFEIIHIDATISTLAMQLVTNYAKSHTLDIPDSLIAATALVNHAQFFTYNRKDFQFIPNLDLII